MRICAHGSWKKTCHQQNKKSSLQRKLSYRLAYSFVEQLTLVLALESHSQEALQALRSCLRNINFSERITTSLGRGDLVLLVLQTSRNSRFSKGDQKRVHASGNEPLPVHSVGSTCSSLPAKKNN